jgi:DNA-binding CsgD family transcriptional regulator
MSDARDLGRDAFTRHAWGDAFAQLSAADGEAPLGPEDIERLATAAYLVGKETESRDTWARAHHAFLEAGNVERAARCAFWLGFILLERGEHAQGSGWLARARRVLDENACDCVERGYLLVPMGIQQGTTRDFDSAYTTFGQAAAIADRFSEQDLITLARHGQGRALVGLGRIPEGIALLDEEMVAVTAGDISPVIAGVIYCSVLSACHEIFDWRRAREWTEALRRWCASQPDLVPFRGQCLVRRAEVLRLQGEWRNAMDEVTRAREWLSHPPSAGVGPAWYQLAELHRLRGEFAKAEEAYREASQSGRKPQPGLALLRLAQGQTDAAAGAIRRVLDEAKDHRGRSLVLPAYVEIMLAADDVPAARAAADELATLAERIGMPYLYAVSAQATGAVLLAEHEPQAALAALRQAAATWRELDAPYEAARVRVLIGLACRALGDHDGEQLELDAARQAFERLGAGPDAARLEKLTQAKSTKTKGGLTARETMVLRLVAKGKTNKAIAADLGISEKTVARHVSNIFTKLGLSSRAAATAFAYEERLV